MEQAFERIEEEYILLGYYLGRQKLLNCVALQHLVKALLDVSTKSDHQDTPVDVPPEKGCCLCKEKASIFKEFWLRYRKRTGSEEKLTDKDANDAWNDIVQLWNDVDTRRQNGLIHANSIVSFEQACQGILDKHKVKIYSNIKSKLNERSNLLKWVELIEKVKNNLKNCSSSLLNQCDPDYEARRKNEPCQVKSEFMTSSMTLVLKTDQKVNFKQIQSCRNTGVVVKLLEEPHSIDIKCSMCTECLRSNSFDDFSSMINVLSKFLIDLGTKKSILNTHKKMVVNQNLLKHSNKNSSELPVAVGNNPVSTSSPSGDQSKKKYYHIISQSLNKSTVFKPFPVITVKQNMMNFRPEQKEVKVVKKILKQPVTANSIFNDKFDHSKNQNNNNGVFEDTTFKVVKLTSKSKNKSPTKMVSLGTQCIRKVSIGTQSNFDSDDHCSTLDQCDQTPDKKQDCFLDIKNLTFVHSPSRPEKEENFSTPTCPAELFQFSDSHFAMDSKSLIICSTSDASGRTAGSSKLTQNETFINKRVQRAGAVYTPFAFVQSLTDIEAILSQNENPSFYFVPGYSLVNNFFSTCQDDRKIGPIILRKEDTKLLKSLLFYKASTSTEKFINLYKTLEGRIIESICRFVAVLPTAKRPKKKTTAKDNVKQGIRKCSPMKKTKRPVSWKEGVQKCSPVKVAEKEELCIKSIATVTAEHIENIFEEHGMNFQENILEICKLKQDILDVKWRSHFLLSCGDVTSDELKTFHQKKCSCSRTSKTEEANVYGDTRKRSTESKTQIPIPKTPRKETKAFNPNDLTCQKGLVVLLKDVMNSSEQADSTNNRGLNVQAGSNLNREINPLTVTALNCESNPNTVSAIDCKLGLQVESNINCKLGQMNKAAVGCESNLLVGSTLNHGSCSTTEPADDLDINRRTESTVHCELNVQTKSLIDSRLNSQPRSERNTQTICSATDNSSPISLRAKYRKNEQGVWSVVNHRTLPSETGALDKAAMTSQYHETKKQMQQLKRRKAFVKLALVDALEAPRTAECASKNFMFTSFEYQSYLDPHTTIVYSNPRHYICYPDVYDCVKPKNAACDVLQKSVEEESNEYDHYPFSFSRKTSIKDYSMNTLLRRNVAALSVESASRKRHQQEEEHADDNSPPVRKSARRRQCFSSTRKHASVCNTTGYSQDKSSLKFVQTISSDEASYALSALKLIQTPSDSEPECTFEDNNVTIEESNDAQWCNDLNLINTPKTCLSIPESSALAFSDVGAIKVEADLPEIHENSDKARSMWDLLPELSKLDDIIVKIENVEDNGTNFWPLNERNEMDLNIENGVKKEMCWPYDTSDNCNPLETDDICTQFQSNFTDIFMFLKAGMKRTPHEPANEGIHTNVVNKFQKPKSYAANRLSELLSYGYGFNEITAANYFHVTEKQRRRTQIRQRAARYRVRKAIAKKRKLDNLLYRKQARDTPSNINLIPVIIENSNGPSAGTCGAPHQHVESMQTSIREITEICGSPHVDNESDQNTEFEFGHATDIKKPKKRKSEVEYLLEGVHYANTYRTKNKEANSRRNGNPIIKDNDAENVPEMPVNFKSIQESYPFLANAYVPLVRCQEGLNMEKKLDQ